jgi:membrane protein
MPNPAWLERTLAWLPAPLRYAVLLTWRAAQRWIDGSGPQLGASIAFYTVFALAPWLVLMIAVAGVAFGAEAARGQIVGQIEGLIGTEAARVIEVMIASAWREPGGAIATVLGAATLLIGASGVFAELRRAINAIAGIHPRANPLGAFLRVRLTAFALLLGFGFLAIASLLLSALVAGFAAFAGTRWPVLATLATLLDWLVSGSLLAMAFGILLRWLPDQPPGRRGLWISAIVAAVLFTIGKHLIGLYLGRASVASSYGAAGSIVVVMLWVYYSAQIMLFGAACGYADEALRGEHARPAVPPMSRAQREHQQAREDDLAANIAPAPPLPEASPR